MPVDMSLENISLVHHVDKCVSNLKSALETVATLDSALFFTSMVCGDEVYVLSMILPNKITNPLVSAILLTDHMDDEKFTKHLGTELFLMKMNHVQPAPLSMHYTFLEMMFRSIHTGMREKPEEVAELAHLTNGDLVAMQLVVDSEEGKVVSGMRIVKNPLRAFEISRGADFSFPDNMTVQ